MLDIIISLLPYGIMVTIFILILSWLLAVISLNKKDYIEVNKIIPMLLCTIGLFVLYFVRIIISISLQMSANLLDIILSLCWGINIVFYILTIQEAKDNEMKFKDSDKSDK